MHDEITQEDISVLNVIYQERIPALVRSNCLRGGIKPEKVFTRHSEGFFSHEKDELDKSSYSGGLPA